MVSFRRSSICFCFLMGHTFDVVSGFETPQREVPAHLNCTAKQFAHGVLSGVVRQLHLAGVTHHPHTSLSFHFDAGRSQPEGGGREVPNVTTINATQLAGPNCTASQMLSCAHAVGGLASLEGLDKYLLDSLEHGVAKPTPENTASLGWGAVSKHMLKRNQGSIGTASGDSDQHKPGFLEVGGGSGAGFQLVCDGKGLSTSGGGGGGGAAGKFGQATSAGGRTVGKNESVGGGGGGGSQLLFPQDVDADPWAADKWSSWSAGGGSGCGSCKPGDVQCEESPHQITCGSKLDDTGAADVEQGRKAAYAWRVGVLRRCYEAGKLAVIGGGGGGAGSAGCCKALPSLNYAFGFRAELKPPSPEDTRRAEPSADAGCCPDLEEWNVTNLGQSSPGQAPVKVKTRRLREVFSALGDSQNPSAQNWGHMNSTADWHRAWVQHVPSVHSTTEDPFSMENSGSPSSDGGNRRPTIDQMISQQAHRFGVDASPMLNMINGTRCVLPSWLNATEDDMSKSADPHSKTKEPEAALKYIYKFNPLQGYLSEGAEACGGWGDWCCACHSAQRRIACLDENDRKPVEWFLTEDCCESSLQKNHSSEGYVVNDVPKRNFTVAYLPEVGWVQLRPNVSDSYNWDGSSAATQQSCPIFDVSSGEAGAGPSDESAAAVLHRYQSMYESVPAMGDRVASKSVLMAEVPSAAPLVASGMRPNIVQSPPTSVIEDLPQAVPHKVQSWEPSWFGVLAVVSIIVVSVAAAQTTLVFRSRRSGFDQSQQGNMALQFQNNDQTGKVDPAYREMKDLGL